MQDVEALGKTGDIVRVKDGFARNYLLPRGLAVVADARQVRLLEHHRRLAEGRLKKQQTAAQGIAGRLTGLTLTFERPAGEDGRLFGSVTAHDIYKDLVARGIEVDRKKIGLKEPIKHVSEVEVPIKLGGGVEACLTVAVAAAVPEESGEPPPSASA